MVTVWISAAGIVGSTVVGVVIGCLGSTPSFYLRKLTSAYTELLRNLPLLVKVFFFYFVLSMPTIPAALLGLVLHQSRQYMPHAALLLTAKRLCGVDLSDRPTILQSGRLDPCRRGFFQENAGSADPQRE